MTPPFNIALAQIDPVLGDVRKNLETHVTVAREAAARGADMVVFPELSLTGYSVRDMNWDLAINLKEDSSLLQPLIDLSNELTIIAGGIEEDERYRIYNSAFLFEQGRVTSAHRKVYPPTYGMFEELRYFSKGDTVRAISTRYGRIGILVCEDLWHVSLPYLLAMDGAELIIALVASPTRISGDDKVLPTAQANTENHKAYARLLTTYIAFCNRVGYEDGVNFWGGSSLVGPDGDILATGKLFDTDLVMSRIDFHEVRRSRRFSHHFLDEESELVVRELKRIQRGRNEKETG